MGRPWRIEYEGALYHVLSRGNGQRNIFWEEDDKELFLKALREFCDRFEIGLFAYVLMPNHYHLLLQTRSANLSRAMQWLAGTYTRRFNNRHNRSGHLFQGRFKSILVQNETYLIRLSCYIHRNPVRAGLVERLSEYPWSSYLNYAYGRRTPDFITTDLILSRFGGNDPFQAYRQLIQGYSDEESNIWEDLHHGLLFGTEEFVKQVRQRFLSEPPKPSVPQQTRVSADRDFGRLIYSAARELGLDMKWPSGRSRLRGPEKKRRDLLVYWLWKSGTLTNEKIGEFFGISHSAVSHCVRRTEHSIGQDEQMAADWARLNSQFKL